MADSQAAVAGREPSQNMSQTRYAAESSASGEDKVENIQQVAATAPATTQLTFRLLDLPAELKLRIYEYAVATDEPIVINFTVRASDTPLTFENRTQPALSKTCREVRQDVLKVYYQLNEFMASYCTDVGHLELLLDWLRCIGQSNCDMLKHLYVIDPNTREVGSCDADLRENLEKLTLNSTLEVATTLTQPNRMKLSFGG